MNINNMPDMNNDEVLSEIKEILTKKSEDRTKQDIYMILPLIANLKIFD